MKKLLLLISFIAITTCAMAQDAEINPAIPHYKILKADSTYTTWASLQKNKPVMIVYFSPDCPHCQHLISEMKEHFEPFKDIQIVLITFTRTEYPYMGMIRNFNRDYSIAKYKNITVGTEYPNYMVQKYYHVATTPFIAIYDKAGKMVKYFDKPAKIEEVTAAVKKV